MYYFFCKFLVFVIKITVAGYGVIVIIFLCGGLLGESG